MMYDTQNNIILEENMNDFNSNLFQGSQIKITALTEQDAENFAKWSEDSNYLRNLDTDYAIPRNIDYYIPGIQSATANNTEMEFGIRKIDNNELFGFIAIHGIEWNNRAARMAIGIGQAEHRSKGYGTEAIQLILRFAFHELNLHRVGLDVNSNNEEAIRSYEKAGFVVEGRIRESVLRDGEAIDRIYMGILYSEWKEKYMGDNQ